jgi:hypothetical protein
LLNIIRQPKLIESAFNPIIFDISYTNYTLGDMFYLEIKNDKDEIIDELEINGDGIGFASFDISDVIQSNFKSPKFLNPNVILQQDETAIISYKVQIGLLRIVDKKKIKHHCYTSDTLYALRSALALDGSQNITDLTVDYTKEAQFLTSVTPNQTQGAELYLPILIQAPTTVKLVLDFNSSQLESTHNLNSLGVWVFNVQPELQGVSTTNFSAWLETDNVVHTATMTAMATCDEGVGSFTTSVTKSSTVSMEDARNLAIADAWAIADANLVCDTSMVVVYTSTKSYTATCSNGYTGSYTATATRTSKYSQWEADKLAQDAAESEATSNLVCTPNQTYTSTKSYTATCSDGSTGSYTATATRTSTISQADADTKANEAAKQTAEANLTCSTISWSPKYASNGCFMHTMYNSNNPSEERAANYEETQMYQTPYDNNGNQCLMMAE